MKEFIKKVNEIQLNLKAPKGQYNAFGKYKYRSCEDILEGLKPVLGDLVLIINDEVVLVGDRIYIKATAKLTDGENMIENSAFAREPMDKKGMDASQVTGTASSYARKYALNGLLLIDDTKDADTKPPIKEITPNEVSVVASLIEKTGSDKSKLLEFLGVNKLGDINSDQLVTVMNMLNAKMKLLSEEK